MAVRAKFKCDRLHTYASDSNNIIYCDQYNKNKFPVETTCIYVKFTAVVNDCEANKSWSQWTPSGELTMAITNPDCFNQFEPGKEYYLDITEVPST